MVKLSKIHIHLQKHEQTTRESAEKSYPPLAVWKIKTKPFIFDQKYLKFQKHRNIT